MQIKSAKKACRSPLKTYESSKTLITDLYLHQQFHKDKNVYSDSNHGRCMQL